MTSIWDLFIQGKPRLEVADEKRDEKGWEESKKEKRRKKELKSKPLFSTESENILYAKHMLKSWQKITEVKYDP